MTEFIDQDLAGARFKNVSLRNARFNIVDLSGVVIRGALMVDVEISAEVRNLRIHGIDVMPYVEAELDRRHPERKKLHPSDPAGYVEAWDILEGMWQQTVDRARRLDPELLHVRVDDEWSFIETQRHLVFATDAWIRRALLGDPSPWHPLDLPHDEMADEPSVPRDLSARPTLDEVLALRADRMATVREVYEGLTPEKLESTTVPVLEPGYPASESYPVRRCVDCILSEEWWHRQFAERDLDALESRQA